MKKLYSFLIFVLFNIINANSQTFRQMFDKLDETFQNGSYSFYSNFEHRIYSYEPNLMKSYLNMYEATYDLKYLNEFVIHSKRVMDRRDDFISTADPLPDVPTVDCSGLYQSSSQLTGNKGWSRIEDGCLLYPHWMESGEITFPMARFILLALNNSSLFSSIILPDEVNSNVNSTNYNSATVTNMYQFAQWLKDRVNETLNWHIAKDWNGVGRFISTYSNDASFNQQCAIGRSLILMYYVSYLDGNTNNTYRDKIELIAYFLYTNIHDNNPNNPSTVGNSLAWYAWCHQEDCNNNLWEDISHAWLDGEFAELYMLYFHPVSGYGRFDVTDMQKFANGFEYRIMPDPLDLRMNVYGTNCDCDQMCCYTSGCNHGADCNSNNNLPPSHWNYVSYAYIFLARYNNSVLTQYNNAIYQEISDFFLPGNTYQTYAAHETLLAYSMLAKYEHIFNPIAVKRYGVGSHTWKAAAGGDFNGNGSKEFVGCDNQTGLISISTYDATNQITAGIAITSTAIESTWAGMAAGELKSSNSGEEIVAAGSSGNIYLLGQSGSSISALTTFTSSTTWAGVACGDISSANSGKEVIGISTGGSAYLFGQNLAALSLSGTVPSTVLGVATGDFDLSHSGDEIATIGTNNKIQIWKIDGSNSLVQIPAKLTT